MVEDPGIETERLMLSIIGEGDRDAVFETLNSKHTAEIISFLSWPMTMEQAEMWCKKSVAGRKTDRDWLFIARRKGDAALAGCIGIHGQDDRKRAEIGYWVSESFQGAGIATEMLWGVVDFAFRVPGIETLFATVAMNNHASGRVLEKGGFVRVGMKDVPLPDGSLRPSHLYERKKVR